MAFDPKKFALLTSAIAASIVVVGATAGGCTVNEVSDADSGTGSSSGEATSSSGGSSSGGSSSGGSSSGGSSSGGSSSGGSSSGGSTDAGVDGGSCLGDDGVAPSCADQTGCLTDEFHDTMCSGVAAVFRPAVARATVDCLRIAPTCEMGEDASECAADAVAQACAVDAAMLETYCSELATGAVCGNDDRAAFVAACKAYAPALSALGKEGLKSCLGDDCSSDSYCFDPSYATVLMPQP